MFKRILYVFTLVFMFPAMMQAATIGPLAVFSIEDYGEDGTADRLTAPIFLSIKRDWTNPPPGISPRVEGRISGFVAYSLPDIAAVRDAEISFTEIGAQGFRNIEIGYAVASLPDLRNAWRYRLPGDNVYNDVFGLSYTALPTFRSTGVAGGIATVSVTDAFSRALMSDPVNDVIVFRLDLERDIADLPDVQAAHFDIRFEARALSYVPAPEPSAVPLPGALGFLFAGLSGLFLLRRRAGHRTA